MSRRRFACLAALLVAVNAFFWLASTGFALPGTGIIQALFGPRMVRADVIWLDGGKVTDTRVDRGVVTAITTTASAPTITLKERDGSTWTIPLAPNVVVHAGATLGTLDEVHRGMRVLVSRRATGAADTLVLEGLSP